jgi:hypothetical protein
VADFVDVPSRDTRSIRSKRRAVKILMIGQPEDVEVEIAHLYYCGYYWWKTGLERCPMPNGRRAIGYNKLSARICSISDGRES